MNDSTDFHLQDFLPYLLNQAAETSGIAFQKIYKDRYGLLRTDWRVLFHLGLYGQMTAAEIGQAANIHKTKISRAVLRLSERRFVTRTRDAADRRIEHLALTSQGQAAYRDLARVAQEYDAGLGAALTADELSTLKHALKILARNTRSA